MGALESKPSMQQERELRASRRTSISDVPIDERLLLQPVPESFDFEFDHFYENSGLPGTASVEDATAMLADARVAACRFKLVRTDTDLVLALPPRSRLVSCRSPRV